MLGHPFSDVAGPIWLYVKLAMTVAGHDRLLIPDGGAAIAVIL